MWKKNRPSHKKCTEDWLTWGNWKWVCACFERHRALRNENSVSRAIPQCVHTNKRGHGSRVFVSCGHVNGKPLDTKLLPMNNWNLGFPVLTLKVCTHRHTLHGKYDEMSKYRSPWNLFIIDAVRSLINLFRPTHTRTHLRVNKFISLRNKRHFVRGTLTVALSWTSQNYCPSLNMYLSVCVCVSLCVFVRWCTERSVWGQRKFKWSKSATRVVAMSKVATTLRPHPPLRRAKKMLFLHCEVKLELD